MRNTLSIISILTGCTLSASAAIISNEQFDVTTTSTAADGTSVENLVQYTAGTGQGFFNEALTEENKYDLVTATTYDPNGDVNKDGQYFSEDINGTTFTFEFKAETDIKEILLWQYSGAEGKGIGSFDLSFYNGDEEATLYTGQSLSASAHDFDFKAISIPFYWEEGDSEITTDKITKIELTVYTDDQQSGGFDKIAFSTILPVPEPSAALLGGLGLLALLRRRR